MARAKTRSPSRLGVWGKDGSNDVRPGLFAGQLSWGSLGRIGKSIWDALIGDLALERHAVEYEVLTSNGGI